ncbi:hypothetical protein LINGRAHAP2_LOCUS9106 [Linum grandiflorum]
METMEDYFSQLPEEIVEKIMAEHMDSFEQLVTMAGVSTSWRSAAFELYNPRRHLQGVPSLLISKTSEEDTNHHRPASNVIRLDHFLPHHQLEPISTIFHDNGANSLQWSSPVLTRRRTLLSRETLDDQLLGLESTAVTIEVDLEHCHCVASRDGWLVLIAPHPPYSAVTIYLLNPVTGASIPLPPLNEFNFEHEDVGRGRGIGPYCCILLSSSPNDDDDCHVIVLDGFDASKKVAWCKLRGGHWEFGSEDSDCFDIVVSATYFRDKLYIVDCLHCVHVLSNLINATDRTALSVRSYPFSFAMLWPYPDAEFRYQRRNFDNLLELNGELIIVLRHCYKGEVRFQVYKLVLRSSSSDYRWEEVTSLDGYAVFLGTHQSLCVPVSNNDNNKMMVKGNHIYYVTDSCGHCDRTAVFNGWHSHPSGDCGVYSLEHQKLVEQSSCRKKFHDYVWFSPMPWDIRKHSKRSKG